MSSNHLILCRPFSFQLQSFPVLGSFQTESVLCIRWPKYWSFSFSISYSNEYSGLISFRMDWFDLLAVQGTLKSLFQHHSSKVLVLWCSVLFIVQLSHPYKITEKIIAWTRWIFVGKVMSLLFNMLPRLTIALTIWTFIGKVMCCLGLDAAATAAKSLQSYLTLCDPMDSSPPGSSIHRILWARILEWVAISFCRCTT